MASRINYFVAIIEGGDEPGYSVFFPDLPGCASAGETIEEAARNAEEALGLHLRGMVEDSEEIPVATAPEHIKTDPEVKEVARFLVRGEIPARAVRLNISLDDSLILKIDRVAQARSMTRSGFIAQATRKALEEIE
jgi:predicted RNase H-like HicB family nuclease